jgi:glycine cleavage system T protein
LTSQLPKQARAVVIGGGVAGCSVSYHLARLGWSDVLLIERYDLADGTSWHSAGFVGQLRSTISHTRMMMYSAGLYAELESATGLDPGWRPVGGLRLARSQEREQELERQAGWAQTFGLELQLLSPKDAVELCPLLDATRFRTAAWLPTDGYLDPEKLVSALSDGARALGVEIATHTAVTGLEVQHGQIVAIDTELGRVATEVVVDAAGVHAGAIARMAGVNVPSVPIQHQYLVTEPLGPVPQTLPTVRDPDRIVYFREKDGGLLIGGYARTPELADETPEEPRHLLDHAPERFEESLEGARTLVPELAGIGIARWINGLESFTPDGEFILGESEVRGFWVATGFCVHGLAGAGGAGKTVAEWIVDGQPEWDVSSMSLSRFPSQHKSPRYVRERVLEAYSRYYEIVYPNEERKSARPLRMSSCYERLVQLGASFGEKAGWERANWFSSNESAGDESLRPRGWAARFWSPAIGAEHRACRESAALFDQSSFAKMEVSGAGAASLLERLCANRVDRAEGSVTYTQMLNARGGIESDFTVTKLGSQRFRIVTGTAFGGHDLAWIRKHAPTDGSVKLDDVTSSYACLGLWGPEARNILQSLCDDDLSNDGFRFLRARAIAVGSVPCLALRVTYVGELGWELYCATEFGGALWDSLWKAGRTHGLLPGGYRAIDSLRLEKGYRAWGTDVTPDDSPWEAGLGFAVKLDEKHFIGKAALVATQDQTTRKLVCLVLDNPLSAATGSEPVRMDGTIAGRVTSGGYGYTVERSIAYAYVPSEAELGQRVEVSLFGEWMGAEIVSEPLYDPKGLRIRS